ncbi:ABC transporter transmembrane region 2, partial [Ostertagia ostertagi]
AVVQLELITTCQKIVLILVDYCIFEPILRHSYAQLINKCALSYVLRVELQQNICRERNFAIFVKILILGCVKDCTLQKSALRGVFSKTVDFVDFFEITYGGVIEIRPSAIVGVNAYFQTVRARASQSRVFVTKSGQPSKDKAHVDGAFFKKLWRILKILIPTPFSTEMFYMILVAVSLLCRTYADVYMIITATGIEAWFGISEMKLRFRERLTKHLYSQYLKGFTFYKMANLDNRILICILSDRSQEYQILVTDWPIVDVLLYVSRIGSALGWSAPVILFSYLLGSGVFLTYLRRPIGRLTVQEQALEGEFRFVNSRLIMNSEEIAFYQGNDRERTTLLGSFANLVSHLRKEYYNSGRMMLKLAEALGRLALAGRELTRLSGFTTRVDTLLNVLGDLTN